MIPEGYYRVTEGFIQQGDWLDELQQYANGMIGDSIAFSRVYRSDYIPVNLFEINK